MTETAKEVRSTRANLIPKRRRVESIAERLLADIASDTFAEWRDERF